MSRSRVVLALGLLCPPVSLAGQATVSFNLSDSVLAIPVGQTRSIDLEVYNCYGVSQYNVTIFADRSRVQLVRVDSVPGYGLPAPTVDSSVADQYTLSASGPGVGYYYCTIPVARVTLSRSAAAGPGSLLSLRLNSATGVIPTTSIAVNYRSGMLDVCQADKVYGDVDQNLVANSRDALIVLSAAVGLPVPGTFDMTVADVDRDGQATSRDALFVLGGGIGLSLPYGVYAGLGVPARCAPLAPAPADLVFFGDNGMERIAAGDTLRTTIPLSLTANPSSTPRWSPDGSRIAYECYRPYPDNEDVCLVNPDGSNLVSLNLTLYNRDWSPDWSPDGTRIAFLRTTNGDLMVANADGTNQQLLVSSGSYYVFDLAWSPDGSRIAFTGRQPAEVYYYRHLYVVNVNGTGFAEVFPNSLNHYPAAPSWSAAGDSIVYQNNNYGRAYAVRAVGDTAGVPVSPLTGYQYYPDWVSTGVGFESTFSYLQSIYFHRASDGRQLRLTRSGLNGTERPDFRRPAGVYVDTVAITPPKVDSLSVTGTGLPMTRTFTASVKNSDGSSSSVPVQWISRDPTKLTVNLTSGLATAVDTTASGTYLIATAGGWRSDSALVKVKP